MLHIAICDDDASIRELLGKFLGRYAKEQHLGLQTKVFFDGLDPLKADLSVMDLLIMEVQMPGMNGLDAAREIRKTNKDLMIIFFTNYVQCALKGYEVQAFRFLLKPLDYDQFARVVGEVLTQLNLLRETYLTVQSGDDLLRIPIGSISYVETERGRLLIHQGTQVTSCRATLQGVEDKLTGQGFFRCHKAHLVALRAIRSVSLRDVILLDGAVIPLSKHRKKALKETLAIYWGEQLQ